MIVNPVTISQKGDADVLNIAPQTLAPAIQNTVASLHLMPQTSLPVMQNALAPSQSTASMQSPKQFCLYFIFEDADPNSKWKFVKFALRIQSPTCTVSQQKSAWAYLLYCIITMKDKSIIPFSAMGDRLKQVYFEKFKCDLAANPLFPLLASLTVLEPNTPIEGFNIGDPNHGVFSIIEHFKINKNQQLTKVKHQPLVVPVKNVKITNYSGGAAFTIKEPVPALPTQTVKERLKTQLLAGQTTKPDSSAKQSIFSKPVDFMPVITPPIADKLFNNPSNIAHLDQKEPDVLSISSTSSTGHEDNVINLDDYNEPDGKVNVDDVSKASHSPVVFTPMQVAVPVIPVQNVVPYQSYQAPASSNLPVLQLATQNSTLDQSSQINTYNASTALQMSMSQISATPQEQGISIKIPSDNVQANSSSLLPTGSSADHLKTGQGEQVTNFAKPDKQCVPKYPRKPKLKLNLGPTLKKGRFMNNDPQREALCIQGTNQVILLDDSCDEPSTNQQSSRTGKMTTNSTEFSASRGMNVAPKPNASKKVELSVSSHAFKAPPHHLSLFDSSIHTETRKAKKTPSASFFKESIPAKTNSAKISVEVLSSASVLPEAPEKRISGMNSPKQTVSGALDLSTKTKETPLTKEVQHPTKIKDVIDLSEEAETSACQKDSKQTASSSPPTEELSHPVEEKETPKPIFGKGVNIISVPSSSLKQQSADSTKPMRIVMTPKALSAQGAVQMPKGMHVLLLNKNGQIVSKAMPNIPLFQQKALISQEALKTAANRLKRPASDTVHEEVPKEKLPKVDSPLKSSPSKHKPSILSGSKSIQLEEEASKRMTASNRWKFSKQRVHVSKREVVVVETNPQHDLLIQPEFVARKKRSRKRKEERNITEVSDEEIDGEGEKESALENIEEKMESPRPEIEEKVTKPKYQPTPLREEKVGNKVYTWVPMKRRVGIMSRSTVDKHGNRVYKSKVKTNKFFSISKKRMIDLGLKGTEGRPLSPSSELENRKKALCKTMKIDDLVDKTCKQAVFLSAFRLISTVRLESACSERTQSRTSRKRQIKAPARYDL